MRAHRGKYIEDIIYMRAQRRIYIYKNIKEITEESINMRAYRRADIGENIYEKI